MEKLEVRGFCPGPKANPWILKGRDRWSARIKTRKEEREEQKEAEYEKQEKEMEVDEATLQEASVEVQSPTRK